MFLPFASLVLDSFGFASGVCPDCRLRPHGNHDHIHGDLVSCLVCFLSASPSPSPSPIPRSRPSSRIVFLPFVVIVILVVVAGSRRARFPSRLPVLLLVLLARGLRHAVLEPRQVVVDLAAARLGGLGLVHTLPQGLLDLRARRRRVACGCPACEDRRHDCHAGPLPRAVRRVDTQSLDWREAERLVVDGCHCVCVCVCISGWVVVDFLEGGQSSAERGLSCRLAGVALPWLDPRLEL